MIGRLIGRGNEIKWIETAQIRFESGQIQQKNFI